LQILKVLEQFELSNLEPWGAEYFHLFAEAAKLCWQDRMAYFGDPDVSPIPIERLLSDKVAREKASQIHKGSAQRFAGSTPPSPPHTANICVADTEGNVVSITATQGYLYGSQVAIEGLGLVMGHGMSRFDLDQGSPNAPAPGKRMFHNMAPTVLLGPGRQPWAAVGLPGGPKIVTVTAQLVVSLVDFNVAPIIAVTAPRVHVEADEPISVSATVSESVIEQLRAMGHSVTRGQNIGGLPDEIGGKANSIAIDHATQDVLAASQAGAAAAVIIDMTR
jgi:gamma-glutamyltranspeptidase/glutathione hydrolase